MRILIVASTQWDEAGELGPTEEGADAGVGSRIGAAWRESSPTDSVHVVRLSDGGTGFATSGPEPSPDGILFVEAQGLAQVRSDDDSLGLGSSYALGLELARLCAKPARHIVLGLPASQTEVGWADGGAGLLAGLAEGLGLRSSGRGAFDSGLVANRLLGGGLGLAKVHADEIPDLRALRDRLRHHQLVVASRDTTPLLGLGGLAANLEVAGRLKPQEAHTLERALGDFSHVIAQALGSSLIGHNLLTGDSGQLLANGADDGAAVSVRARDLAAQPGGAAFGGVGFILNVLGAHLRNALEVTAERAALNDELDRADVVLTVSPVLDAAEMHDGVTSLVAGRALTRGIPVIVLTGQSEAGRREWSALGVSSLYEPVVPQLRGEEQRDLLAALIGRVPGIARTWSR